MGHSNRKVLCGVGFTALIALCMITGCGREDRPEPTERIESTDRPVTATTEKEDVIPSDRPITETRALYAFTRGDLSGWEIPQWAHAQRDYVATNAEVSGEHYAVGGNSMKVTADFPGGRWTAALVEIQQYLDLSMYRVIKADVFLPADAPMGLTSTLILTVGDNWRFVEMNRSFPLIPGEWITITAYIEPGSYDWKRMVPDEKFAEDIRKIAVRVESNNRPQYSGDFFVDNIRVGR